MFTSYSVNNQTVQALIGETMSLKKFISIISLSSLVSLSAFALDEKLPEYILLGKTHRMQTKLSLEEQRSRFNYTLDFYKPQSHIIMKGESRMQYETILYQLDKSLK